MTSFRSSELSRAVGFLNAMAAAPASIRGFALCGVQSLSQLVNADWVTLSICDLASGRRQVVSDVAGAIAPDELAAFNHHFHDHPLVRFHAYAGGRDTHCISDSMSDREFRATPLFNDYYRRIGLTHALAMPLHVDKRSLVSFVMNRSKRDFSDAERMLLELVRVNLAHQFRTLRLLEKARAVASRKQSALAKAPLSPREQEILNWVATGKTNSEVADIVGISIRTVHKHLEHIFTKLGVETRTAAVMRALSWQELH